MKVPNPQASLKEILATMDARLLPEAEVTVDILGKNLNPKEIAEIPHFAAALTVCLRAIVDSCGRAKSVHS